MKITNKLAHSAIRAIAESPDLVKKIRKIIWFICFFIIIAGILGGPILQWVGFDTLREMRQMERIPKVSAGHVVAGEVNVRGKARLHDEFVTAKYSGVSCFYCFWLKEKEERDSEGDKRWVTVDKGVEVTDFFLVEKTGRILVELSKGGVAPDLELDYSRQSGDLRFREYRIDKGELLTAFAMAVKEKGEFSLRFDEKGSYTPVLSYSDALENRTWLAMKGVFFIVGGIALSCFVCYLGCTHYQIHRVLPFLFVTTSFIFVSMFPLVLIMVVIDLRDGENRLERMEKSATSEVSELIGGRFDWRTLPSQTGSLNKMARNRILGIREDYIASIERTNSIRDRFPERWLAPLLGIDPWPSLIGEGEAVSSEATIAKTPIHPILSFILMWLSAAIASLGFLGFRRIKIKRYIENVPTSLSTGLAYGPAEIKGRVEHKGELALTGPLSSRKCVYFHYRITESRGSGDSETTVVIKDERKFVPFHCRDTEGVTEIDLHGAEITGLFTESKQIGRQTHTESFICDQTELYALGTAVVDKVTGSHLVLSRNETSDFPFLVSGFAEKNIMLHQSWGGLFGLGCAQVGIIFIGLFGFGSLGSFSPSDFLLSALLSPLVPAFVMFILMFNDLVFLRNRVKRAWANIEVSLKKRSDLIPILEKIVKTYLSHERSTMETLSRLRSVVTSKDSYSPSEVDAAMKDETALADRLIALRENYPDLKGNQMMDDFMNRLVRMENEVALMRAGYNDGIERYREAKQRIPEVLIAKIFRFKNVDYLKFSMEVREVPALDFESNPKVDSSSEVPSQENEAE